MGVKLFMGMGMVARYRRIMKNAPREILVNPNLLFSSLVFAFSAFPSVWDQGSASVLPSLPGYQKFFHLSTGANAGLIRNLVSLVYIGYAIGSASTFFINDRLGRLWSYRLYTFVYMIGQIVAITTPGLAGLNASRIVSGMGIGALTVTGPMTIAEISPDEIRGLLTSWFGVCMSLSLVTSVFCVYGAYIHMAADRLQYQIVWFMPILIMFVVNVGSFFCVESPKWLMMVDRYDDALRALVTLRGLPADHPRVQAEITTIQDDVRKAHIDSTNEWARIKRILHDTFMIQTNLRRVVQSIVSYGFAQLSGANQITSYLVPIMTLMGVGGSTEDQLFLSGMYGVAKLGSMILASFLLVDALGRRNSLFIGITCQIVSHLYVGIYIKYNQEGHVTHAASQGALAFLFIHAFGYVVGLFLLPYVFGAELWPDHIRTFGGAFSQTFHWLFIYAMNYGLPPLLTKTHNWGAFIFFAAMCFLAMLYVFFMVPETSELSTEEIDLLFQGPWFKAYKSQRKVIQGLILAKDEETAEPRSSITKNSQIDVEEPVPKAS
ncbi:General substrate transporter [Niveomyces insectorum RCEF 264]|uniref:General substrate transporter n=1 Tax=Niveomyces insectorum RCEF 264 TaxID=1081102 RepID=A0A167MAX3_9HYPO|nr:General substrate transporter [Niveomyces insectorum RCEF 264]